MTPCAIQQVYIVDDDAELRHCLSLFLHANDIPVQAFDSAEACLQALTEDSAGCMILDMQMPGINGLELQKKLKDHNAAIEVIFASGQSDIDLAVKAMKNGALEFLQKPFSHQQLLQCVYHALEINSRKLQKRRQKENIEALINSLSKREKEVMDRMINGDLTKVIAADLGISPRTAEIHRHHVMEKMQAKTLAQLVHLVLQAMNDV